MAEIVQTVIDVSANSNGTHWDIELRMQLRFGDFEQQADMLYTAWGVLRDAPPDTVFPVPVARDLEYLFLGHFPGTFPSMTVRRRERFRPSDLVINNDLAVVSISMPMYLPTAATNLSAAFLVASELGPFYTTETGYVPPS